MKKYLLPLMLLGSLSTQVAGAASIETDATIAARAICSRISEKISLEPLPEEYILLRNRRYWADTQASGIEVKIASTTAGFYAYACQFRHSKNPAHDKDQAIAWHAKAALLGNPYAFYRLGIIFSKWIKKEDMARTFMQAAADLGEFHARVRVGLEKEDY